MAVPQSTTDQHHGRVLPRVDAALEVTLYTHQSVHDEATRTANISAEGLFVVTSRPLPVGTGVRAELRLPDGRQVKGYAEVVWIRPRYESRFRPNGMGLHYTALRPDDRKRLAQFVRDFEGESMNARVDVVSQEI